MGCITEKHNVQEQLEILRTITAKDNDHLTVQGYKSLALGLAKEAISFTENKQKEKQVGKVRGCNAEWHGFVSNSGVGKTSQKAIKKLVMEPGPTPYKPAKNFPAKN